jgi:hypothetical protein
MLKTKNCPRHIQRSSAENRSNRSQMLGGQNLPGTAYRQGSASGFQLYKKNSRSEFRLAVDFYICILLY